MCLRLGQSPYTLVTLKWSDSACLEIAAPKDPENLILTARVHRCFLRNDGKVLVGRKQLFLKSVSVTSRSLCIFVGRLLFQQLMSTAAQHHRLYIKDGHNTV